MEISALIFAFLMAMEPESLDKMEVQERIREGRPTAPETVSVPAEIKSRKEFAIIQLARAMGINARPETQEFTAATIRARQSAPDIAQGLLGCYHKTASLKAYQILGDWRPAWQYGADHSLVFRLNYAGMSGSVYSMDVAIASKPNGQSRAFVINDNAFIPYNKKCGLETFSAI